MTNVIGTTNVSDNGADESPFSINKPTEGGQASTTIVEGQDTTLNFDLSDVAAMSMDNAGGLVIKFDDGSTLTLNNFAEMAQRGVSSDVRFSDGSDLDFVGLHASLTSSQGDEDGEGEGSSSVVAIVKPVGAIGETGLSFDLAQGGEFVLDFNKEEVTATEIVDGDLVITFADGTTVTLENYETAGSGALPPAMTLADGTVIGLEDLVVALGDTGGQIVEGAEELGGIEPAAGSQPQSQPAAPAQPRQVQSTPQDLAAIEPAAGEAGVQGAAGTDDGTANFDSAIVPQSIGGLNAVGPIGITF